MWSVSLISPPVAEALDISPGGEVYQHLRLEPELTPQDSLIQGSAEAARGKCESFTQRQLVTATWELWLDEWCERSCYRDGKIYLPYPPLQPQVGTPATAGVLSVKHLDDAGVEQTWDSAGYQVVAPQGPRAGQGYISLAYGETWPSMRSQPAAIKIRYTAGYGATFAAVPAQLRKGMLLIVGELEASREEQIVGTITSPNVIRAEGLWSPFREW